MKKKYHKIGTGILIGALVIGNFINMPLCIKAETQQDIVSETQEVNNEEEKGKVLQSGTYKETKWTIYENGLLEVTGSGDIYGKSNNRKQSIWKDYAQDITSAKIEVTGATNLSYLFAELNNLEEVDLSNLDTSQVTTMKGMFYACEHLRELDLGNFNTSKVVDMCGMFEYCEGLEVLDVSSFDTSQVKTMANMFANCSRCAPGGARR